MASLIGDIVVKRYAIMKDDFTILSDTEVDGIKTFYPERKKSIHYISVVEIGGSPYLLGSNAVVVSVASLNSNQIKSLLEDDTKVFSEEDGENEIELKPRPKPQPCPRPSFRP